MSIHIQSVTAPDAETFLDLCAELNAFDGSSPFDRAATGAALGPLLDDPHKGRAVFLLADGQVAGYLVVCFGWSFEFGGRTGVLEHLWVREAFRGRGLATAAIAWAEQLCRDEGAGAIYLGVESSNARAQGLYTKCGFNQSDFQFWIKPLEPT